MNDVTVFSAGSGTISGIADEDITLDQMTTTNATSSAVTLNTARGNILDGDTSGANDLTAVSGTVSVTTGGGTFGTTANAIEVSSTPLSTTGLPVATPTSEENLTGSTETVGEASVDQTINIVKNLVKSIDKNNQKSVGGSIKTVALGVGSDFSGSGPLLVDVFAESYELVNTEGFGEELTPAVEQLNDFWFSEGEED